MMNDWIHHRNDLYRHHLHPVCDTGAQCRKRKSTKVETLIDWGMLVR